MKPQVRINYESESIKNKVTFEEKLYQLNNTNHTYHCNLQNGAIGVKDKQNSKIVPECGLIREVKGPKILATI